MMTLDFRLSTHFPSFAPAFDFFLSWVRNWAQFYVPEKLKSLFKDSNAAPFSPLQPSVLLCGCSKDPLFRSCQKQPYQKLKGIARSVVFGGGGGRSWEFERAAQSSLGTKDSNAAPFSPLQPSVLLCGCSKDPLFRSCQFYPPWPFGWSWLFLIKYHQVDWGIFDAWNLIIIAINEGKMS